VVGEEEDTVVKTTVYRLALEVGINGQEPLHRSVPAAIQDPQTHVSRVMQLILTTHG